MDLLSRLNERIATAFAALTEALEEQEQDQQREQGRASKRRKNGGGKQPRGVDALTLGAKLFPIEGAILAELRQICGTQSKGDPAVDTATVARLEALAEAIEENTCRRGHQLVKLVQTILHARQHGTVLRASHARDLEQHLSGAVRDDVAARMHELRDHLRGLPGDEEGFTFDVSRAPYRLVRERCKLNELDTKAIEALYTMPDRRAWLDPICEIETRAFMDAQRAFRLGLATGVISLDRGDRMPVEGIAKRYLQLWVRARLDWASDLSHMVEDVFYLFFAPLQGAPEPERTWVLKDWALEYGDQVARFLNIGRNEALLTMNELFERVGKEPYPYIQADGVPHPEVRRRDVGMPLEHQEELRDEHRTLHGIGVKHLLGDRSGV